MSAVDRQSGGYRSRDALSVSARRLWLPAAVAIVGMALAALMLDYLLSEGPRPWWSGVRGIGGLAGFLVVLAGVIGWLYRSAQRVHGQLQAQMQAARAMQATLRDSEQRFHCIFSQAAVGICLAQPDGTMKLVNQKLCDMLGYRQEELLEKTYQEITYAEDWPPQVEQAKRLMAGEIDSYAMDKRYLRKDGSVIWANLTCSLVRGQTPYVVAIIQDINARKQTEEALRESEGKFRHLAENAHAAIGIVRGTRFVYANPYFAELSGYSVEELLTMHFPQLVHPAFQGLMLERARRRQAGEAMPSHYEFLMVTRSGEQRWVDFSPAYTVYGGQPAIIGTGFDVTARKQAEAALRESEERLRLALDCAHMISFEFEPQSGRVVWSNPDRAWGPDAQATMGYQQFLSFVHPDDRDRVDQTVQRIVAEPGSPGPQTVEYRLYRPDGSLNWVLARGRALLVDGEDGQQKTVRCIGIGMHITDRKLAEQQLEAAREAAERAQAAAEEASRAKDHFLAVLSHELRNPLTPVLPALQALETMLSAAVEESDAGKRGAINGSGEAAEYLQIARRNVELEARLIDDLLDVTRIARGKVELERAPVELCTVLRWAAEVCRTDVEAKQLRFEMRVEDGPHWVYADAARLQQVFWNLIKNAVKFTPPGGLVQVRCRREEGPREELGGRRDERGSPCPLYVIAEVSDSGVGIEPEALGRIFNAFEQEARATTREFGGLGLGLAISKALVEMHGGTVQARSEGKGRGATFAIRLPIADLRPPVGGAATGPANRESETASRNLRILLVEDHADTARILVRLLRKAGHDVEHAGDMATALQLAGSQPFDVMVSDLGLPDGSGCDLMRQLEARGHPPHGIALSGYGMPVDVQRSREAGFAEHLVKPVNIESLKQALNRVAGE